MPYVSFRVTGGVLLLLTWLLRSLGYQLTVAFSCNQTCYAMNTVSTPTCLPVQSRQWIQQQPLGQSKDGLLVLREAILDTGNVPPKLYNDQLLDMSPCLDYDYDAKKA